ncbi:MAG: gas vesicle protein [Acidobacteria bacterium]|nr:gas vesicle protein [Acidobacteriota bacterium]
MANLSLHDRERVSLCEALDRVLNKGAVVIGEVTISVADVDLIYLGLQIVLTSIESGRQPGRHAPLGARTLISGASVWPEHDTAV